MNSQSLIRSYSYTASVIHNQLGDVTHTESLMQPVAGGHSINWLLGHIVSARSFPLWHVGAAPVWSDAARARYRNGSQPIGADEPGVLKLDALIDLFDETQSRLTAGLQEMTAEQLSIRNESGYAGGNVCDSLLYFHFHESYHVGQMTMIAELLGRQAAYVSL